MKRRKEHRIDLRLVIGLVLVAASVAGVWGLVSGFDRSERRLVARETLVPGSTVHLDDFVTASVRLGSSAAEYLAPTDVPAAGLLVVRTVGAGEVVPAASVTATEQADVATVVVPIASKLPSAVKPGALVDIWAAAPTEGGGVAAPAVLVAGAEVAKLADDQGMVVRGGTSVELVVPRDRVGGVLQALALESVISLVPTTPKGS
ncbi:MAG TPA: hypothetical protein VFU07_01090 [Candidatus Lumbricidophila sp.]|nr:hypothetical protein [Candidatus Lumbricidophila sp.]